MTSSLGVLLMTDTTVRILSPAPITSTGVRSTPVIIAENVPVTYIDPVGADAVTRYMLESTANMFECQTDEDTPVEVGFLLYEYSTERTFNVKFVRKWTSSHKELILEFVRPSNV